MDKLSLGEKWAKSFGLLKDREKVKKDDCITVEIKGITELNDVFIAKLQLFYDEKKIPKEIKVDLKKATSEEATFMALLLETCSNPLLRKKNGDLGYVYKGDKIIILLERVLQPDNSDASTWKSCLPYYLLAKQSAYSIKNKFKWNDEALMRRFTMAEKHCPDPFPGFYIAIADFQKSRIRKWCFLEKGLETFPKNAALTHAMVKMLNEEKKYSKSIDLALKVESKGRDRDFLQVLFEAYLHLPDLKKAKEVLLKRKELESDLHFYHFDAGRLEYKQGEHNMALKHFYEAIKSNLTETYHYFDALICRIDCFLQIKDWRGLEDSIEELCYSNVFERYTSLHKEAIDILERSLECPIKEKSKYESKRLLGFFYYRTFFAHGPIYYEDMIRRARTKEEAKAAKKGLENIKEAMPYFPHDEQMLEFATDNYIILEDHENAIKTALQSSTYSIGDYARLEKCRDGFLDNLANELKPIIHQVAIKDGLIENNAIFNFLWETKRYQSIVDLFLLIQENNRWDDFYEKMASLLFKAAYSFSETGNKKKAKHLYEKEIKLNGEGSSTLNNLALIYENEGDEKKATELIKKAKSMLEGEDEVIERNYERIVHHSEDKNGQNLESDAKEPFYKYKIYFDLKSGMVEVEGESAGTIEPGTRHFVFFKLLYEKMNMPVSHKEIYENIKELKISQSHLSMNLGPFCYKIKSELKTVKNIKMIDEIVIKRNLDRDTKGYIMIGRKTEK